jgi:hypothetical protein
LAIIISMMDTQAGEEQEEQEEAGENFDIS